MFSRKRRESKEIFFLVASSFVYVVCNNYFCAQQAGAILAAFLVADVFSSTCLAQDFARGTFSALLSMVKK